MHNATLEKANNLNKIIIEFQKALNCFQWDKWYGGGTTNPRIIIEYDCEDGRETRPLPMNLSDEFVLYLKAEITKGLNAATEEFNAL